MATVVRPIDGNSLFDLIHGNDKGTGDDTVYSEMLAEGVQTPCYMIRKGVINAIPFIEKCVRGQFQTLGK